MYSPAHFRADESALAPFIHANGFATLTNFADGDCHVSHIPLMLDEERQELVGHLARANPHWRHIQTNPRVLAVFHGPHAYVSAGWYHGPGVPTWNYAAVHVRGDARLVEDAADLREIIACLTAKYEAPIGAPWDGAFPATMLRGIVGIRIAISSMVGKFKLSQNRSNEDRESVIKELNKPGLSEDQRLAAMMSDAG